MANTNINYRLTLQDLFTNKMNAAISQTQKLDQTVNRLQNTITSVFAVGAITGFAKSVIDTGSAFERSEIQLRTLLQSSVEAKRVFNDLKDESVKSPFGFDELLRGNALLISAGLTAEQAKEDFNGLANAIAGTGGGNDELSRMVVNLMQIKNAGKASAMDLKQFAYAGINLTKITDDWSKKHHTAADKAKSDYTKITEALKEASQKGGIYYNALNNMADSTSGRLSNLSDSFKNLEYELFNALRPTINDIVVRLTNLMSLIVDNLPTIIELGKDILVVVAAFKAYRLIMLATSLVMRTTFVTALMSGFTAMQALTLQQLALNSAMLANPIGLVVGSVMALVSALMLAQNHYDKLKAEYQKGIEDKYNEEAKKEMVIVDQLTKKYQDLRKTKEEKAKYKNDDELKAINFESKRLANERAPLESQLESINKQIAAKQKEIDRKNELYQKINYRDGATFLTMKDDPLFTKQAELNNKIGSISAANNSLLDRKNKLENANNNSAAEKDKLKDKVGEGITETTTRPQNLYINIDKLIETQVIKAENVTESKQEIKRLVGEALLEAVNDVNLLTK